MQEALRYRNDAAWQQHLKDAAVAWQRANRRRIATRNGYRRSAQQFVVTDRDLARLLHHHRGSCGYCHVRLSEEIRTPTSLEWDHVVPLAKGGTHSVGNLIPACRTCNRRKHGRFAVQWKRVLRREQFSALI